MKNLYILAAAVFLIFFTSCFSSNSYTQPSGKTRYVIPNAKGDPAKLLKLLEDNRYTLNEKKPSDPHLALLYKYSPDAYYILRISEDYLQDEIKIGSIQYSKAITVENEGKSITTLQDGTKVEKIRRGKGFRKWIDYDKSFDDQVKSLSTAVHEENHGLTNRNALYVLSKKVKSHDEIMIPSSDRRKSYSISFDSYYINKEQILYARKRSTTFAENTVFPASRLEEFIPEELRTFRYKTYIDKKTYQSTQICGISGLIDEYNSYYWSNKVIYDLFDYYRLEKPQTRASWQQWTEQVFAEYFSWAEFRYWILNYVLYAKEKEKRIYNSLMDDRALRQAFTVIDDNFTGLISKIFNRLGKELPEHLKKYNINVTLTESSWAGANGDKPKESFYKIENGIQGMFLIYFLPVYEELNKSKFIELANDFRTTPQPDLPSFNNLKNMMK